MPSRCPLGAPALRPTRSRLRCPSGCGTRSLQRRACRIGCARSALHLCLSVLLLISYSSRRPSLPGCIFSSAPPLFLHPLLFHSVLALCLLPCLSLTLFPAIVLLCFVPLLPGLLSPCSPPLLSPFGTLCCCLASFLNLFPLTPLKASYATGQRKLCITQVTVLPNLY